MKNYYLRILSLPKPAFLQSMSAGPSDGYLHSRLDPGVLLKEESFEGSGKDVRISNSLLSSCSALSCCYGSSGTIVVERVVRLHKHSSSLVVALANQEGSESSPKISKISSHMKPLLLR